MEQVIFLSTPITTPKPQEVIIKIVVAASDPKDWNGDDLAGIFKPGDRVAVYHESFSENGSYAEYATASDWTTFHIATHVSFEKAATVPVAVFTTAMALYVDLKLIPPFYVTGKDAGTKTPILIYGVGSAVGAFAAKFARLFRALPIIGVAGRAGDYVKTLVDHVVDYHKGEDALTAAVEQVLESEGLGRKIPYIFDSTSENYSLEATLRFIEPNGGKVATVLPPKLFAKEKGKFGYPPGITGINSAVPRKLRDGKASAMKYV
ncbi:hypothetical protein CC80DRAFT_517009 [Byssothecium circinans]|uniref:GroES-like protein n=1 Tax=Byssothecium circinans TaxID=147558 RepID=A0A6A5TQF4_9PLEO|nr:hypothetical protein CC80DRAFT_517009 [Byssothecium circinans]